MQSKNSLKRRTLTLQENQNLNMQTAHDDFDWSVDKRNVASYSQETRVQMEQAYDSTFKSIEESELISGVIVGVTKTDVIINIGFKSDGLISLNEFRDMSEIKVGDEIEVLVVEKEDRNGHLHLSRKLARQARAWQKIVDFYKTGEIVTGTITSKTKGGLIVDVFGIEAFLPGSQIDVKPIRDYDVYVGKIMELKVVKINNEFKNVVVSHKALIEAELEEQKKQIMSGLEKGQVLEGVVKNITSYGVFVDLGGVDGLIHITDLSWGRIVHPEEIVQLDSKINVVILDFDDDKKRIALGLKQLSAHPWDAIQDTLEVGQKIKGKVVVLADYGAFVEIAPGVEGLIHVSEMSWSSHLRSAQDFLKVGQEVEAVILSMEKDERKLSLGLKQLTSDPWDGIESRFPVGSKHTAKVRAFTTFGIFCELADGIDGLVHISDLSWSKKIKHPSEFCAIGDDLAVVVLELDREGRKISLGHKQVEENPWDVFETVFVEGTKHQGTIVKKEGNHCVVALPYGLEGFCLNKNMKKEDGATAKVEETLDFIVLEFNKNKRKIAVSHTQTWKPEEITSTPSSDAKPKRAGAGSGAKKEDNNSAVKQVNSQVEKSTLGDLGALAALKEKMDGEEGA